jgi:cbb3-type cytochrome oxidase subunit 3
MPDNEHPLRKAGGEIVLKVLVYIVQPKAVLLYGAAVAAVLISLIHTLDRRIIITACVLLFLQCVLGVQLYVLRKAARARRSPEMQALVDSLNKVIQGTAGPGAAELQLRAGIDSIARAQASALASQRGMNPALASREIVDRNAALMVEANKGAAELRAKEVEAARQQLADILAKEKSG